MSAPTDTDIERAFELGRAAHAAGEPAGFPFEKFASDGDPVGTWTEVAREWARGWHAANLADDPAGRTTVRNAFKAANVGLPRGGLVDSQYATTVLPGLSAPIELLRSTLAEAGIRFFDYNDGERDCVAVPKPPKLNRSDLFHENEPEARALWADGFRPTEARFVQPGQTVVYWATDVFQLGTVGGHMTATVRAVTDEHGTTEISHGGGTTEADECSEVWTR